MNLLSMVVDFDVLSVFQEFEKICRHFIVFDEQFEYGARLPPMFIRFVDIQVELIFLSHDQIVNIRN